MPEEKKLEPYDVPMVPNFSDGVATGSHSLSPVASLSNDSAQAIVQGIELKKKEVAEIEARLDEKIKTLQMLTDTIKASGRAIAAPTVEAKEETPQEYAKRIMSGRL